MLSKKVTCVFCGKITALRSAGYHKRSCRLNPTAVKEKGRECPACKKKFIAKSHGSVTCSHSCSNTYFRSNKDHPNWKESRYRTTCFAYHKKECVVCGEDKIVAVHHHDENRDNNDPSNLIPLCPTHHHYVHSRYKHLVLPIIEAYIQRFLSGCSSV